MLTTRSGEGITVDYDPCLFCFLYFFVKCLLREMEFWDRRS